MRSIANNPSSSLGQAWAAANNWFWNFLISRFTPQMFNAWGYGVYFFFASLMFISVIFIWFLVPETKSIPLEVMDRLFEIRPVWRANSTIMAELHDTAAHRDDANLTEKGQAAASEFEEHERKNNSTSS